MARSTDSTKLDTIIQSGVVRKRFRVLTCDANWPVDGDGVPLQPPFPYGIYVNFTTWPIPESPTVYASGTFSASVWSDVTNLITEYNYNQDSNSAIDQLSLTVPIGWTRTDISRVFREMRVIVVQEQFTDGTNTTGWINVCFCLSDGFIESFDDSGTRIYRVSGKDILKLANIDYIGSGPGFKVYQPDIIKHGEYTSLFELTKIAEDSEAIEYGILSTEGYPQPNWADKPSPQLFFMDIPGVISDDPTDKVPLSVGGDAVQVVFGEGIVRISKSYIYQSPGETPSDYDYSVGLGYTEAAIPVIKGVVYRFSHGPTVDRSGNAIGSDVFTDKTIVDSGPGWFKINGDYSGYNGKLSVLVHDGTGRKYICDHTDLVLVLIPYSLTTKFTLTTSVILDVGTKISYGNINQVERVLFDMLLDAGFQTFDSTKPFYLNAPEIPKLNGTETLIVVPPLVYKEMDKITIIAAIEDLRKQGYIPPNYITRADANGCVSSGAIQELDTGDTNIIPIDAVITSEVDRSDINVATRVVARGLVRQVEDVTSRTGTTILDVASGDGGVAYNGTWLGITKRSSPGTYDYVFNLSDLLTSTPATFDCRKLRPWGEVAHLGNSSTDMSVYRRAEKEADNWKDKFLCEITIPNDPATGEVSPIERIDLSVVNPWITAFAKNNPMVLTDQPGWYDGGDIYDLYPIGGLVPPSAGLKQNAKANYSLQILSVWYYDDNYTAWLPLISYVPQSAEPIQYIKVSSDGFDTRVPTYTSKIRIKCLEPTVIKVGTYDENWYYGMVGVFLSRIRLWTSAELHGIAELGRTAPFNTTYWKTNATRLRRRTYILEDAVPWVSSQVTADNLAVEWLKEKVRDLAPRKVAVIRPDVKLWDTVSFALPNGDSQNYLITSVTKSSNPSSGITGVNYTAPYYEV